jgi:hypothetical protein
MHVNATSGGKAACCRDACSRKIRRIANSIAFSAQPPMSLRLNRYPHCARQHPRGGVRSSLRSASRGMPGRIGGSALLK